MRALRFAGSLVLVASLYAFQQPFKQYPGIEHETYPLPPDYQEKTEFAFARLMYPPGAGSINGYQGRDLDWHTGISLWSQDFPAADRHFMMAMRRLSRVHSRSVEQIVNLDDDDEAYNWPWLYAVQVGEWGITDSQAAKLRDYCLRGGFFMADDFHGTFEWGIFQESMHRVFPDRPIVDIDDKDPIFHTVYDLDDKMQIPGQAHLRLGYKADGKGDHWRGIFDDKGRVMIAISFNSDIGDAWEYADDAFYPEKFSGLAIRIGVNYITYAMTH
jgi:Domain of unknown function (DUF4159)